MLLNPKKRFIESPHGKAWSNLVESEMFQVALEAALAHYTYNTGVSPDMTTAAAIAARAEGARLFINTLLNLTNPDKEPVAATSTPRNLTPTK